MGYFQHIHYKAGYDQPCFILFLMKIQFIELGPKELKVLIFFVSLPNINTIIKIYNENQRTHYNYNNDSINILKRNRCQFGLTTLVDLVSLDSTGIDAIFKLLRLNSKCSYKRMVSKNKIT